MLLVRIGVQFSGGKVCSFQAEKTDLHFVQPRLLELGCSISCPRAWSCRATANAFSHGWESDALPFVYVMITFLCCVLSFKDPRTNRMECLPSVRSSSNPLRCGSMSPPENKIDDICCHSGLRGRIQDIVTPQVMCNTRYVRNSNEHHRHKENPN